MPKPVVNFEKIAILNAVTTFADSVGRDERSSYYNLTREWALTARTKGMDASYVRAYNLNPKEMQDIVNAIKATHSLVIIPYIYLNEGIEADAYHLRSVDHLLSNRSKPYIFGKSCHTIADVTAAGRSGLDYVFFSPIFQTPTHPEAAGVGLEVLGEACRATRLPVFALGGINSENAKSCIAAGARGVAAISMFLPSKNQ